jgi:6-phosphogluconolactonase
VTTPAVVIHRDQDLLAKTVAARLVTRLVDVQAARGTASVGLTGGGVGTAVLAALTGTGARDAIDWRNVDVDPARVHPMPAADGPDGDDPEAAAARYADLLLAAARPEDHGPVPSFDVLMLGLGPDAHVASLFPGQPALYDERPVVAVRGAPKPPPTRITLTLPAIQTAQEVWVIAAGEAKAGAAHMSLSDAGPIQVPAAGARGRHQTLFLLDRAAASRLPRGIERIASP